jgi:hypothetical protein
MDSDVAPDSETGEEDVNVESYHQPFVNRRLDIQKRNSDL